MPISYYNIKGSVAVENELLAPESGRVTSISIANVGSSYKVRLSLYLQDTVRSQENQSAASTIYLYRNLYIPIGVTLILDEPEFLTYNTKVYGLYARIESPSQTSQEADIIVRTE